MNAVKTNEEIYQAVLEENNFLPNVFTLEGIVNLLSIKIDRVPYILYKLGNSIKDFEALAYNETKTYNIDKATEYIQQSKILETKLTLFMANGYLTDKFNFPVDTYKNGLFNIRDFLNNERG